MEQLINTLVSSLLSIYLPISEVGSRIAISLAISGILTNLMHTIITYFWDRDILYFWNRKMTHITIEPDNPLSEKILKYIYEKYNKDVHSYKIINDIGKNKFVATKFKSSTLNDQYIHKGTTYDIRISLEKPKNNQNQQTNPKSHPHSPYYDPININIKSTAAIQIIELYFNDIVFKTNTSTYNKISIFRTEISNKKDNRSIRWKSSVVKLSKTVKNTIVSDSVKKYFYDDIANFMQTEQTYLDRGLPYKRGYLLYGVPGCGKTSLIKAIANQYKIPIFIIDMSIIKDNSELIHITNDISSHLIEDQKYMVVFEDIDRSKMFKGWHYGEEKVTMDCFLNVLDGVDEYHGRITILTSNDIEKVNKHKALMRPGRIDTIVELSECTIPQISQILHFFFNQSDASTYHLDETILITPAQLIQLILSVNNIDKIVHVLNTNKNFSKIQMEKVNSIYHAPISTSSASSSTTTTDAIEETEEEPDPDQRFIDRIKTMERTRTTYDLRINQLKDTMNTVPKDKIAHDRCILNKQSLELKIIEFNRKIEMRKHKRSQQDDTPTYRIRSRRRSRLSDS